MDGFYSRAGGENLFIGLYEYFWGKGVDPGSVIEIDCYVFEC